MENVKKLFTLFILLISSVILFNHQSFSKKLTERHFIDYQNEEDNHNLQNNDNDKIENDDDDNLQDDDIDDITTEEEQKDEFLMLKVIFLLVFVILILFSIFFWIYLLNDSDDEKKRGIWKFSRSLEDKYNIKNFSIPNEFPSEQKVKIKINDGYLKEKKKLFIDRDYKFYKKIDGFLDSFNADENGKDYFYFYLLRFIVPEYSDQRGFPCFYEKRNGDLEFGHSLINNEKNKLYQMTENKGNLFEKMSAFFEKGEEGFFKWFFFELIGFLRVNSYLNFFEDKVSVEMNDKIGEVNAYIFHYLECYSSYDKDLLTQEEKTIQTAIDTELPNHFYDNNARKIFFKNTYGEKIKSDIEKLIYFLFCRCFMNIVMQKKIDPNVLTNFYSSLEGCGNNNNICYSFKLMPRASSISKDYRENFLGKKNNENMCYVIEINAGEICKCLASVIKFISDFINKKICVLPADPSKLNGDK